MSAQLRALTILASALDVPVLSPVVRRLTRAPSVQHVELAGIPTFVARPATERASPVLVFLNGATPNGCDDPAVKALVPALARAGYLVVAPELPGLRDGVVTEATAAAAVAVVRTAPAPGRKVSLLGVSAGASLALLAAAEQDVGERISVVIAVAPWGDLREVVRLATTGRYRERDGGLVQYGVLPLLAQVVERSLSATVPEGGDAAAIAEILRNRDPERYDELVAALPDATRAALERLSPVHVAARVRPPVELASAPLDGYFPLEEALSLARRLLHVRLTVTSALDHVRLRPSPAHIRGLIRFNRFAVRSLAAARSRRLHRL